MIRFPRWLTFTWAATITLGALPTHGDADASFARSLVTQKECYRAITEYLRLIHEHPDNPNAVDWKVDILGCYARAEEYDELFRWTTRWLPDSLAIDSSLTPLLAYPILQALEAEEYDFILGLKKRSFKISSAEAALKLNRGYVLALSGLNQDSLAIATAHDLFPRDSILLDALNSKARFKPKSKTIGLFTSLFPGGGYLYGERYGTGFASMAIMGLLSYGMYESLDRDQHALAIGLGIVNLAWYSGSISVSSKMVEDWNQKHTKRFSIKINKLY